MAMFPWAVSAILCAIVMMAASRLALRHAVEVAAKLGVPPFVVGFTLVAVGTDLPELTNSLVASYLGHGDINVGDSTGSVLTQGTLVLGLFPFVVRGALPIERREALVLPALTLGMLAVGVLVMRDGRISRLDGGVLVAGWALATWVAWRLGATAPDLKAAPSQPPGHVLRHVVIALLGFAAVGLAAAVLVRSISAISVGLGVPEYVLSFFGASIGTSLPELAVELTALRQGRSHLALGDVLGSCFVDASLSVGLGPLLYPTSVTAGLAVRGSALAAAAMTIAGGALLIRRRHDHLSGIGLIGTYVGAYFLLVSR